MMKKIHIDAILMKKKESGLMSDEIKKEEAKQDRGDRPETPQPISVK